MSLEAPDTWWVGNFMDVHSPQMQWIPGSAGMTAPRRAIGVSGAPAYVVGEHRWIPVFWIPAFAGMTVVASIVAMSMASCPPSRE